MGGWAEMPQVLSSSPSGDKTWKGSTSAIQYNYIKKKNSILATIFQDFPHFHSFTLVLVTEPEMM